MSELVITGTPMPLSASVGGAAVPLDGYQLPGQVVHANPSQSGGNDILRGLHVYNPNVGQATIHYCVQGAGIAVPPTRDAMKSVLVPGQKQTPHTTWPINTPEIISPGYNLTMVLTADDANPLPLSLYGVADRHAFQAGASYGGLWLIGQTVPQTIPTNTWIPVPFNSPMVGRPVNVTIDQANSRFRIDVPGIWFIGGYGVVGHSRNSNDRTWYTRWWDIDANEAIDATPWPMRVGNAQEESSWGYPAMAEISDRVGRWIRQEIGGCVDRDFDDVVFYKAGATLFSIAPQEALSQTGGF